MKRKIIKGIFAVVVILCLSILFGQIVLAHPGGTDEYGGHYDRETGWYHYHHGYPPHSHTNGTCPYDFDDKTGWNSGSSSGSTVKTTTNPPVTTTQPQKQTSSSDTTLWTPPPIGEQVTAEPTEEIKKEAVQTALNAFALGALFCIGIILIIEYYYIKVRTEHEQFRKEQKEKGK